MLLCVLVTIAGFVAPTSAGAAPVAAPSAPIPSKYGDTPGTYSDYSFGSQGITNFTSQIRVTDDPGRSAASYWATQFGFIGTSGGYVGMQANSSHQERTLIFSAWDTTDAVALSPGAYCTTFTGEGRGRSCRMRFAWVEDRDYRFRIDMAADGWATFTFTDVAAAKDYPIGRIKTHATQIAPTMSNWVEYFEWSHPTSNCNNQPFSSALFSVPTTVRDGKTVAAAVTRTNVTDNTCAPMAAVDVDGQKVRHTLGIGNSARGRIQSEFGNVLTGPKDGTAGLTAPATRFSMLTFSKDELNKDKAACMEYGGGETIRMGGCDADNDTIQAWQQIPMTGGGFFVRNPGTNMCLDHENGDPSRKKLVARTCGTAETNSQRWYLRGNHQLGVALTCVERQADNSLADALCQEASSDQRWYVFPGDSMHSGWVHDTHGMIRNNIDQCLTDTDYQVLVRACDDNNSWQRWLYDPIAHTIRANHGGQACLTQTGPSTAALRNCDGTAAQRWTMPLRS